MLNVSRLLCGSTAPGDSLRYGEHATRADSIPTQQSMHYRPVVVWNITRRCNLHCIHCYSESKDQQYDGELSHQQVLGVLDDLADYGIPVLLFSGGEPMMREGILDVIGESRDRGIRTALSTNGTMITPEVAQSLKDAGLAYVGISIDGLEGLNDRFRAKKGAYQEAMTGIRNARAAGFRVSLRFTLTRYNMADLDAIFDLVEEEGVPRFCIYHLAYAGRGNKLLSFDLSHEETREAMDLIFRRTIDLQARGKDVEVLTVDNHADAVYLMHWVRENMPERADEVEALVRRNGGNSSGKGIACIDNVGDVHPDQFWRTQTVGNVLERPFSEIWNDESNELLYGLRNRKGRIGGRCGSCDYFDMCNGNLRVRAESAAGDVWAHDPACYLTDDEITLDTPVPVTAG